MILHKNGMWLPLNDKIMYKYKLFVVEIPVIISLIRRSNSKALKEGWEVLTSDYGPTARTYWKSTVQKISVESNRFFDSYFRNSEIGIQ